MNKSMQIDFRQGAGQDDRHTLTGLLSHAASVFPERNFLQFGSDIHTYGAFHRDTNRLARGLASLGVKPGDTVASLLDNNLEAAQLWFAINKIGAIGVPTNTAYKMEFLQRPLADAAAKVCVVESHYMDRIAAIEESLTEINTVIVRDSGAGNAVKLRSKKVLFLRDLFDANDSALPDTVKPGDLSVLVYTSGTTGLSKGCMLSHNYLCNIGKGAGRAVLYTKDDVVATSLPLFHINAMANLIACLMVGAKISIDGKFSVSNYWASIANSGATVVTLLGSIAVLLAAAEETEDTRRCYGQLRAAAGAPFDENLVRRWKERFGVKWVGAPGYGLTEACLVTSIEGMEESPSGASGRRNDDFEVRIVDDEDRELPPNTPGEIICRPRHAHIMFEGYWRKPEATLNAVRGLWFHTGDIGKFDENGFFYFLCRKKEYLRRRGENISSFELETILQTHPDLQDVSVHAVPSPLGEDDIKVVAVQKRDAKLTEEALCRWAIERFPYFAVPSYVEFRPDLPRNPMGKVMKYQLEKEGITPGTWSREAAGLKVSR